MKIVRHIPERVDLFLKDKYVATLENDIELAHVQLQIAEGRLEGYYIGWKEHEIPIDNLGQLKEWPRGMYDESQVLFSKLFSVRKENLKKE